MNVIVLAACCTAMLCGWFVLAGKLDWKLQVLSSLTESCDFLHGLDRVTGNMSEINGGLREWWKLAWAASPTTAEETPPHPPSMPCILTEDVPKWFLFNTMWDNNTSPSALLLACCA